jgi:hypothetical protein
MQVVHFPMLFHPVRVQQIAGRIADHNDADQRPPHL